MRLMKTYLPSLYLAVLAGCGARVTCGPGTFEQDLVCLPVPVDTEVPADDTDPPLVDTDADTDAPDESDPPPNDTDTGDTDVADARPGYFGDIVFTDASGMASFCQLHDTVYGNLTVRGFEVTDLAGLGCLRRVIGNASILAETLTALSLPLLTEVTGSLTLTGAHTAITVDLPVLERVDGSLILNSPDGLVSLLSLSMPTLAVVGQDLRIDDSFSLGSVELPALTSVGRHLWLRRHVSVGRVALPALAHIGGALRVEDNAALTALEMPNVPSIGSNFLAELAIEDNAALADLSGLAGIRSVGASLVVRFNPSLPTATAEAFRDAIVPRVGGTVVVEQNGP
jgi:hypothetical protein